VKNAPNKDDLAAGIAMYAFQPSAKSDLLTSRLHEKCWQDGWDRELTNLWRMKMGKMTGYHQARREMQDTR
jgi:hypothetical protein